MSILVSIIVIYYNSEDSLPELLMDLAQITADDIEIILVDDGSTDGSSERCTWYVTQDKRFRMLRQKNAGPSAARNNGLRNANGRYVVFFDSDDRVDSAAFLHLLQKLRGEKEADIWCSDFFWIDRSGTVFKRISQIEETEEPIFSSSYLLQFLRASKCYWSVWRYVFCREFLQNNELFFPEGYRCAEDLRFMTCCLLAEPRCAFFHNPYYRYVVNNEGSLSHNATAERMCHTAEMLEYSLRLTREKGELCGAKQMEKNLTREYMINLSLLYDVPGSVRPAAKEAFKRRLWLLKTAKDNRYRLLYAMICVFGFSTVSVLSCSARHIWRLPRRLDRALKVRFHGRAD